MGKRQYYEFSIFFLPRLETLETKFNCLVEELTKHRDTAIQLAQKNQVLQ